MYILQKHKERIKLVSNSGFVKEAFDAMDENINDKLTEVAPSGFDAVIECSGNKTASTMETTLRILASAFSSRLSSSGAIA